MSTSPCAPSAKPATPNPRQAKKAYERGQRAAGKADWQGAFEAYSEAIESECGNREYLLRRDLARSRIVQQYMDRAEREALLGQFSQAQLQLRAAIALDPRNQVAHERLLEFSQLAPTQLRENRENLAGEARLQPLPGKRSFDYRGNTQGAYEEVARQFGVEAAFDEDLLPKPVRLRIAEIDFDTALQVLDDMTGTFWKPLTSKLFFVAADIPEKHREFDVSVTRTVLLPASTTPDTMTELLRMVREVAGITRADLDIPTRTITLRATPRAVAVASKLLQQLEQPPGELVLEMEVLDVDRNAAAQLGITPPQSATAFTLSKQQVEEAQQSVQGLIDVLQQIFGANSTFSRLGTAALASLVGSGQVSLGSLIPPLVAFGGGNSTFFATLPGAAVNFSNALSLVRNGQRILLRAEDGRPATFFVGDRVPITLGLFSPSLFSSQFVPGVTPGAFPRTDFATGRGPNAVAAADFTGDNAVDLAVTNQTDNTVSILLNNGSGSFTLALGSPPATGNLPDAIVTGNFDPNNPMDRTDLAVANFNCSGQPPSCGPGTVSILLGNGDGTFPPKTDFPAGQGPVALATGKFNLKNPSDQTDLAVVNQVDNSVTILLSNDDGTFSPASGSPIAVGRKPASIAVADFNGDGFPDLAITNQTDNTATILLGNGDGTFSPAPGALPITGNSPAAIVAADFNLDSRIDLAVANQADNTVSILLGNGDGTFGPKNDFSTGASPVSIASADFNIDGRPDLAVADQAGNTVSILIGLGDGTFAPRFDLLTGTGPIGLTAADFVGNNRPDLAIANQSANTVTVILNIASFVTPSSTAPQSAFPNSEYVDIGLKLKVTPRIHPDKEVTLKLHFELSSLSGMDINGIPIITNRSIDQTVRVRDNQTSMLAGFLNQAEMRAINGTPGLAELSAAGLLAGGRKTQEQNSELLILVTPRLVRLPPKAGKPIYAGREPAESGALP